MHPFFLLATIICLIVGLLYWNLRRTLGQAHTEPVITITREERINAANKQQEVLMKVKSKIHKTIIVYLTTNSRPMCGQQLPL